MKGHERQEEIGGRIGEEKGKREEEGATGEEGEEYERRMGAGYKSLCCTC